MSWRQIGAKPSTTTMLSLLRLEAMMIHITHITQHTYRVTTIKHTMLGRSREVNNPLIPLLLVGSSS